MVVIIIQSLVWVNAIVSKKSLTLSLRIRPDGRTRIITYSHFFNASQKMIHSLLYTTTYYYCTKIHSNCTINHWNRGQNMVFNTFMWPLTYDLDLLAEHSLNKKWSSHGNTSLNQNSNQLGNLTLRYRPVLYCQTTMRPVTCDPHQLDEHWNTGAQLDMAIHHHTKNLSNLSSHLWEKLQTVTD